ncbi:MAG TPA: hypothetical protein VGO68_08540 [Pyrinomonadaceae bacterium]|jgi:hypothetical protein|nr:hypothetical protein [Pyrinomonadaceae bacterium]
MTKNVKIALGCGGVGCLGLIVVVVAVGVFIFTGVIKAPGIYSPPNRSSNYNYNRNSNVTVEVTTNDNANSNSNSNSNSSSDSSATMSDDDRHKLLMAASFAADPEMMQRVMRKLGFITDTGVAPDYAQFLQEHAVWAHRNQAFIDSVNTQESARAYLNAHIDD